MIKIYKNFFFIFFIFIYINDLRSEECNIKNNLKVGLISNEYIDYRSYLDYHLSSYSYENSISYEIDFFKNNPEKFDIIFGEYHQLEKFNKTKTNLPNQALDFYKENRIKIENNILPLDLDTFILLSKKNLNEFYLEDLGNFKNRFHYSLGLSFFPVNRFSNIISYNIEISYENDLHEIERIISFLKKNFYEFNRDILKSNFIDTYNSYESNENLFTLFSDGILLYKNLNYKSFQLLPKSKYKWNNNLGIYKKNSEKNPISFFGFSAYLNNSLHSGFICYLTKKEIRLNSFKNFNIQLSPLSEREIKDIVNHLPIDYVNILKKKSESIKKGIRISEEDYLEILNTISNSTSYTKINKNNNYLN